MKRLLPFLAAVVLALGAFAAPAAARTPDDYIKVPAAQSMSGTDEFWPIYQQPACWQTCGWSHTEYDDPACGTSDQVFRVVLYQDTYYGGNATVLCRPMLDFCNVPGSRGPTVGCWNGVNDENDSVSSVSVGAITGTGTCIHLFKDTQYGGGWEIGRENTLYATMSAMPLGGGNGVANDQASSIKKAPAIHC